MAVSSSQEEFARLRQKYLSSFKLLDKNRDGYITINEITAMFETMESPSNAPQLIIVGSLWQVYYRHGESGKTWRCGMRVSGSLLSG